MDRVLQEVDFVAKVLKEHISEDEGMIRPRRERDMPVDYIEGKVRAYGVALELVEELYYQISRMTADSR